MFYIQKLHGEPEFYYRAGERSSVFGIVNVQGIYYSFPAQTNNTIEMTELGKDIPKDFCQVPVLSVGNKISLYREFDGIRKDLWNKQFIVTSIYPLNKYIVYLDHVDGTEENYLYVNLLDWDFYIFDKEQPVEKESTINDGDIIEKDGKQFIVTLTEVIPQKYPIGTVINDVFVIIDTCLTEDNKHRNYTLWNRKFGEIWYRRENEIEQLYKLK